MPDNPHNRRPFSFAAPPKASDVTLEIIHDRLRVVEMEMGDLKVASERVETKVDILAKLAEEEREERRLERAAVTKARAATDAQRAKNEAETLKLRRVKWTSITKIAVALVSSAGFGLVLGKLLGGCA